MDNHQSMAVVSGTSWAPVIDLRFDFDALHALTGDPLRTWVKEEMWASFDATTRTWSTIRVPDDAMQRLLDAGFSVTDAGGEQADLRDVTVPVLCRSEINGMVSVYPRMGSEEELRRLTSEGAIWQSPARRFLVPDDQLATLRSRPVLDLLDNYIPIDRSASAVPLLFDGTIDGLRAVPMSDLDCADPMTVVRMREMGISSVYDLLHTIPRRYLDRSNPVPVSDIALHQDATFIGTVREIKKPPASKRGQGVTIVTVVDDSDGRTRVSCRWFNASYIAKRVSVGQHVLVSGKLDEWVSPTGYHLHQINNPLMDVLTGPDAVDPDVAVIGVYPASKNVTTWAIRRAVKEALRRLPDIIDPMPPTLLASHTMPNRSTALRDIHSPASLADADTARQRLAYDELMRWQVIIASQRYDETHVQGLAHDFSAHALSSAIAWPFELTGDQKRAIEQIEHDLSSPTPMMRLLQGDVGSGKTAVMMVAALDVAESGHTAAILAPTEVLASQHMSDLEAMTAGMTKPDGSSVRVEMLSTKVTGKKRKAVLAGLADGSVDIVVGTSALLSKTVNIAHLGLVVIDEQHRFGVEQRGALTARSEAAGWTPDILVMTATPAPRTAVLTIFGDLDVSVLAQMPAGRAPITTSIEMDIRTSASPVWIALKAAVSAGRQGFVVTPVVSSSETKMAAGAEAMADQIRATLLPGVRVGFIHGKQLAQVRNDTMGAFSRGELDVLVSTTVIEVGVNVPNATVMVITGAESFGIAQLHQIRGRVGRGNHAGTCYLVPSKDLGSTDSARLEALVASTDGFALAQKDLEIRGPGSLSGVKQSGKKADLRIANLITDLDLVVTARADAMTLIEADPGLARHPLLRSEMAAAMDENARSSLVTR